MKRLIIILAVLILGIADLSAQDIITKRNGEDIRARITAIGPDTISYQLYDINDGITYTIMKSDVVLIRYKDGRNEVIRAGSSSYDPLLYGSREPVEGIRPGMKYSELKDLYNYKEYIRGLIQNHNPTGVGVASFFIPGLGQMICGEGWRGTAFLGGWLGASVLQALALQYSFDHDTEILYLLGTATTLGIKIWSIVDATRVAKVKNMYERDLMRTYSINVDLHPSVNYIKTSTGIQPTAGLTLAMRF